MILGVGTDILQIRRIYNTASNIHDAFVKKTFTENEIQQALKREDPVLYFATRFAGKEAVFKSLQCGGNDVLISEIQILNDEKGIPKVSLSGRALKLAEEKGICEIHISLSYETDFALAFAIAQKDK